MTKYRCGNCNYVFEPRGRVPGRCPYCSETGKLFKESSILDNMTADFEEE